jgi:hypothetical protein
MRKLKVILMAAMAIAALSAISASAAQAAQFTTGGSGSAIITTDPDGTGTATHHVFDSPGNGSITCAAADFKGTVSNGATEITVESDVAGKENEPYTTCTFLGFSGAFVKMNGCEFVFEANGGVRVQSKPGRNCATEPIEFGISGCVGKVGPQNLTGATYKNLTATEITLSANVSNIAGSASGALCLTSGSFTTGQYTTGNTIITGLNDGSAGSGCGD